MLRGASEKIPENIREGRILEKGRILDNDLVRLIGVYKS